MSTTLHLVCPHCSAINRIPEQRLGNKPVCGRCKAPLFIQQPLALTAKTFAQHISHNNIPVLVDFWAPWCGPCKMMAPAFKQAAAQLEPQVRLAKVNTEVEQTLAAEYSIRSIPTLVLFKQGKEVSRQAGAISAQDIVRWARAAI